MSANEIYKQRIYNETKSQWEYTWSSSTISTLPVNPGDTVTAGSVSTLGQLPSRVVTDALSPFQVTDECIEADSTGGNMTVTLPDATRSKDAIIVVIKTAATNTVTVDGYQAQFIDGAATVDLTAEGEAKEFQSDGTKWVTQTIDGSFLNHNVEELLPKISAKGDLLTGDSTGQTILPVQGDGMFLKANSATATGLEWAAPVGDTTTVSNIGTAGVGIFKQITTEGDIELKKLNAGSTQITVTDGPNNVILDLGQVDHTQLLNIGTNSHVQIDNHIADDKTNPHSVTAAQVGLGNVANISSNLNAPAAPGINDDITTYQVGSTWIDTTTNLAYVLVDSTDGAAVWQCITTGRKWVFTDEKPVATNGGTFTGGLWVTRDLNVTSVDGGSQLSLTTNQITVAPGRYRFRVSAPAYRVDHHRCRLYNVTDTAAVATGSSEKASNFCQTRSTLTTELTVAVSTTFRVEHQCTTTSSNTGFGTPCGFGSDLETYTTVEVEFLGPA